MHGGLAASHAAPRLPRIEPLELAQSDHAPVVGRELVPGLGQALEFGGLRDLRGRTRSAARDPALAQAGVAPIGAPERERSAIRNGNTPSTANNVLGVRPARAIVP